MAKRNATAPEAPAGFQNDKALDAHQKEGAESHGEEQAAQDQAGQQQPQDGEAAGEAQATAGSEDAGSADAQTTEPAEVVEAGDEVSAPAAILGMALAMVGIIPENFPLEPVANCLADFYLDHPTAPFHAGPVHVRMKLKVILDFHDSERGDLAIKIFHHAITGMAAIAKAEAKSIAATAQAQEPQSLAHYDRHEGAFAIAQGGIGQPSDLGKALSREPTETSKADA